MSKWSDVEQFDRFFADALGGMEVQPPAYVWTRIRAAIRPSAGLFGPTRIVGAVILLMVMSSAGVVFFGRQEAAPSGIAMAGSSATSDPLEQATLSQGFAEPGSQPAFSPAATAVADEDNTTQAPAGHWQAPPIHNGGHQPDGNEIEPSGDVQTVVATPGPGLVEAPVGHSPRVTPNREIADNSDDFQEARDLAHADDARVAIPANIDLASGDNPDFVEIVPEINPRVMAEATSAASAETAAETTVRQNELQTAPPVLLTLPQVTSWALRSVDYIKEEPSGTTPLPYTPAPDAFTATELEQYQNQGFRIGTVMNVNNTWIANEANAYSGSATTGQGKQGTSYGLGVGYDLSAAKTLRVEVHFNSNEGQAYNVSTNATEDLNLNFVRVPVLVQFRNPSRLKSGRAASLNYVAGMQYGRLNYVGNLENIDFALPRDFNTNEWGLVLGVEYDLYLTGNYFVTLGGRGSVNTDFGEIPPLGSGNDADPYNLFVGLTARISYLLPRR